MMRSAMHCRLNRHPILYSERCRIPPIGPADGRRIPEKLVRFKNRHAYARARSDLGFVLLRRRHSPRLTFAFEILSASFPASLENTMLQNAPTNSSRSEIAILLASPLSSIAK